LPWPSHDRFDIGLEDASDNAAANRREWLTTGLGSFVSTDRGDDIVWRDGGTGAFGTYNFSSKFAIIVRAPGHRLFVQATDQPEFEVLAESATDFFLRAADAQISFERNVDGETSALVLHQNGRDLHGQRPP
jgi:hypothetical protein